MTIHKYIVQIYVYAMQEKNGLSSTLGYDNLNSKILHKTEKNNKSRKQETVKKYKTF